MKEFTQTELISRAAITKHIMGSTVCQRIAILTASSQKHRHHLIIPLQNMQRRLGHSRPPPKVRLLGVNDLHAPSTRETNSSLYPSRESLYSLILNLHLRDERAGRKAESRKCKLISVKRNRNTKHNL